ncbi:Ig-like domain-containing protein [Neobacillus sp. YX16]|uniref:Ig-like domain-containing protein n=1 Tax=Neobacillus sp. YX16 TaxID=3047874 RepID=UPI0024C3CF4D|nr:Ig-like domain-containing protein [Neobacillus sp. YX16]WHZ05027.1 Ig-like domain-containing protein [Neobacillus sp. YX16]
MQNQLISNKKSPFPLGAWQLFTFYLHFSLLAQEAIKQAAVTSEGNHTLVVTDTSGNEITVKFTIDKTSTVVTGVSNNGLYKKDVIITFNEGTATLDGDDSTSGKTVTSEGSHTLVVTDAAGNATTVNFTIDKTAPNAPTVDTVTSKTTEVTGTAEANSTIVVKEGKDTIGIGKTDQDGKFTISIEKQKKGTNLYVTAKDIAGNVSAATKVTVSK